MTNDVPLSDIIKQALDYCIPRKKPKRAKYHSKFRETQLQPTLGRNIRSERIWKCMSPEYVASKSGIPKVRLLHIEEGHKTPTLEQFVLICRALEVLPHVLLRHMITPVRFSKEPKSAVHTLGQ